MKSKTYSSSIFGDFFDAMFVTDKHGKLFIFPWGRKRKGYLLDNPNSKPKIRNFYWISFAIYFLSMYILTSLQNDFWSIILIMLTCSALWLINWYFYSGRIIKSAKVSNLTYSEIILEKIEADVSDDKESSN